MDILNDLNPMQREAVETTEGPLLVLAGAGSGKTKVLTYRIAFILSTGLAGPTNILAMTFTNKAAGEMKERIAKILKGNFTEIPWMGTFHSIAVKILKRNSHLLGFGNNFTIYDGSDSSAAVKEAMKRLNISIKEFNPEAIKSYISSAKNELISAEDYQAYSSGYFQQIVAQVYPEYQKVLRENNAMDFDDLLFFTVQLFREYPKLLESFQDQFKYILVDEYQDTNHSQYTIITMLAKKWRNICCVGDDDQSIYAFRGATIKNILSFEKDYSDSKVVKLEQNYRSTKTILEASYDVISKNKGRKDKKLWTENPDGDKITLYTASDEIGEADWIIEKIQEINKVESLNDIAILYRTNAQSRSLEESFVKNGIPYKIVGGLKFYDRKEIKDTLAYLKILNNPKDNKALERIINTPKRGVGDKGFETLSETARQQNKSVLEYLLENKDSQKTEVKKFVEMVNYFILSKTKIKLTDLVKEILEKSGYLNMLKDGTLENESRLENINELVTVATKYDEDPEEGLVRFLDEVALLEGNSNDNPNDEVVTLMTIHAAKGLEFNHVFVVGMEENLFPHTNSMLDQSELEEERRLAYVAITRARNHLYLTNTVRRKYFGKYQSNPQSRFVNDISKKYLEILQSRSSDFDFDEDLFNDDFKPVFNLQSGDLVKHDYFGKGTVKTVIDNIAEVDFGGVYGVKELMLEYAKLTKL